MGNNLHLHIIAYLLDSRLTLPSLEPATSVAQNEAEMFNDSNNICSLTCCLKSTIERHRVFCTQTNLSATSCASRDVPDDTSGGSS